MSVLSGEAQFSCACLRFWLLVSPPHHCGSAPFPGATRVPGDKHLLFLSARLARSYSVSAEDMKLPLIIPGTNTLLLIWNHSAFEPNGDHFGKRSPLTLATSRDRGQTWQILGDLAADPAASYDDIGCYFLSDGSAVVTFRFGLPAWKNLSLHAFVIPPAWYSRP